MPKLTPEILESGRGQFGVPHGVLNVFVAQVGLESPRVVTLSSRADAQLLWQLSGGKQPRHLAGSAAVNDP